MLQKFTTVLVNFLSPVERNSQKTGGCLRYKFMFVFFCYPFICTFVIHRDHKTTTIVQVTACSLHIADVILFHNIKVRILTIPNIERHDQNMADLINEFK